MGKVMALIYYQKLNLASLNLATSLVNFLRQIYGKAANLLESKNISIL